MSDIISLEISFFGCFIFHTYVVCHLLGYDLLEKVKSAIKAKIAVCSNTLHSLVDGFVNVAGRYL